jgi:acetylornithine deacetylase/succinyl-diaminopimelate desuccinylase-like protein
MKPATPLEITQALVRIPSVNPNYDPVSPAERDVAQWIQTWGFRACCPANLEVFS